MSTRKSTVTVGSSKVENADAASKDKDKDTSSNLNAENDKTTNVTTDDAKVVSAKIETDTTTTTRSSTPTQKESAKAVAASGTNSNSRVTRNSPLLISPNIKKDQQPCVDSEPTNSESEDGSVSKKQIRGRKSIKEAKESTVKEPIINKENLSRSTEEHIESKDKSQNQNSNKEKENQEKDTDNNKDQKDKEKDIKNLKESKECKDAKSVVETERQVKDCEANQEKNIKESKDLEKDSKNSIESSEKDLKDSKEIKDKDAKDPKENKDKDKDTKDSKETKDKDLKETKDPKEAVAAVTNRLTRNAAAQEVASKSRITRNRQSSAGSTSTRPETPPTARRGRPSNPTRKSTEPAVTQKRKRSVEEPTESPITKVIKTEPKDITEPPEDDVESSVAVVPLSGNADLEGVRIKQELIESDDGGSTITERIPTTATRGRRWGWRKATQTVSPSTRSTRQNKIASPVPSNSPAPERKRRRTAGQNTKGATAAHATPDEDSKDSMASSMDDILVTDIKMEKLTPEFEENPDVDMEIKKSSEEEVDENTDTQTPTIVTDSSEPIVEPLTIETEVQVEGEGAAVKVEESEVTAMEASTSAVAANCLNKDASLSPELVSEGVSEISVKQFYNRPKFLENNLGIEEDPKLGEIVQKVTTELDNDTTTSKEVAVADADADADKDAENGDIELLEDLLEDEAVDEVAAETTNNPHDESFSAESIKEGDLVYEESNDGKKTPVRLNSTEQLTPLVEEVVAEVVAAEDCQEDVAIDETLEAEAAVDNRILSDTKEEEELLEERLVMAEEDLDDDDVTVEESETISMDNNPSLHDDAPEEEPDLEEDNQVDELPAEVSAAKVSKDVLVDEIPNDKAKQQTSNVCDIEKAKLEIEVEKVEETKKDETTKPLKVEEIKNESAENNDKEVDENIVECSQKEKEEEVVEALTVAPTKEIALPKADDKNNAQKALEIKKVENKSIIVTKFDSDEKEPTINLTAEVKADEKVLKSDKETSEVTISSEENKLTTIKIVESMDVDELKAENMETDEIVEDDVKEDSSVIEKMDISRPTTPVKDEKISTNTSDNDSPIKSTNRCQRDSKDEDANSVKSTQSTDATSWTTVEPDCDDEEKLRQKELHLKNLGLLTHKAAAKRRQEFIQTAAANEATRAAAAATASHHHGKRNGGNKSTALSNTSNIGGATTHEYTGTLKTVIKLNRNASGTAIANTTAITVTTASTSNGSSSGGRKSHITNTKDSSNSGGGVRRQSLKMTFQKGRGRGHTTHGNDRSGNAYSGSHSGDHNEQGEDLYYTIQNENEGAQKNSSGSSLSTAATAGTKDQQQSQKQHITINNNSSNVQTHGRKPYNSRSNTSTSYHHHHYQNHHFTTNSSYIDSSHSEGHHHHDGMSHHATTHTSVGITSHKKDDREEILIPEKASSFKFHPGRLCEDQCYYCSGKFGLYDTPCHVGQIKSIERQQKILKNEEKLTVDNCLCDACFRHVDRRANVPSYKKRLSASGQLETHNAGGEGCSTEDGGTATNAEDADGARKCVVPDCGQSASHSLRRKCIRKSVKKFLLNFDMPTGSPYIWLCQSHYDAVIQCSGCVLCKRRLGKNHMYHITSDTERLEKALTDMGIPVQLGIGTAVCKLCRYFANLLMKPPDSTKSQKAEFVKNYRKRLLQFHNIHDGSNDASEADEDEANANTNSSVTNDGGATNKAIKGKQTQRKNNDQTNNTNSPTASSSSSVICMTDNTVDRNDDKSQKKSTLLENEVLMDYDMSVQNSNGETSNENSKSPIPIPAAENEKSSRLKAILQSEGKHKSSSSNSELPSVLLRANPNLSMRELFPGEEDLGLQFKAPFGSSNSQRTPEGWTRVQTFLQYDEPTRRLWEELQKPYGNQSSFLRHLILLEKYYRNGDLVLSANASSNASVYTQTVRQRLNSYDQGHCGGLDAAISTNSPAPETKETKAKSSEIPLVEINDDDDEDETVHGETSNTRGDKLNNDNYVDDDDDVIMEETPSTPSSAEKNPTKRRSRSISVDKLTKQLSTNAVTITARPKDSAQASASATSKHSLSADSVQKRNDLPKLQPAPSASLQNSNASGSLPSVSAAALTALATMSAPASIASSSNSNSRSILKSNLLGITNSKSVEILPISTQKSATNTNTVSATTVSVPPAVSLESSSSSSNSSSGSSSANVSGNTSKQQKILEVANKLLDSQMEAAAAAAKQHQNSSSSILTSPPELVSLQRRSLPSNVAASTVGTANTSSTMSSTTASLINAKRPHLMANRQTAHNRGSSGLAPNVVILPNTLSTHERAESKSWRPTLMSVEENQHLLNKNGPLYQTADGRRLPGLVQVQSGGKPFLISIFDYNRMCILRREKLMRDGMLHSGKHKSQQQQQRHSHTQQQSSNYNKMNSSGGSHNSGASGSNSNSSSSNSSSGGSSKHSQANANANAAQQQFMQLLHFQKQQQQQQAAAMKAASNAAANNNRYHPIAPKPTNSAAANLMAGGSSNNTSGGSNMNMTSASNSSRLAANQSNFPMPLLANALSNANSAAAAAATLNNNPWLWSNFPDAHELLRNGAHGGLNKLPPLLPKPTTAPNTSVANNLAPPATITSKQLQQHQQQQQQHHQHQQQQQQQQMLLDNTLMSKIPKSLTVIPQHKLMGSGSNAATKE